MDPEIPAAAAALGLDHRQGWPAELRFLLEKHPRGGWAGHSRLGTTAR